MTTIASLKRERDDMIRALNEKDDRMSEMEDLIRQQRAALGTLKSLIAAGQHIPTLSQIRAALAAELAGFERRQRRRPVRHTGDLMPPAPSAHIE